jgi:quercetin dioxygenase-like cupin family protein
MGAERAIDFAAIDWVEILPGLRAKVCQGDGRVVRLVEFGGGFEEPGWCEKGHAGYVVSGRLTVRFDDGIVTYETGQGVCIASGDRHRVVQPADQAAVLFLTEPA